MAKDKGTAARMYDALKALQQWSWAQPWPVREADVWHEVDAAIASFEAENAPAPRVTLAGTQRL